MSDKKTFPITEELIDALAAELERARELSGQVVRHIVGTYEVERDGVGEFLVEKLSRLEEDEIDLVLSPLYTPKLTDQAIFAVMLVQERIPRESWPELVRRLVRRPVTARLQSDGGSYLIPLPEVVIERFVYRLRLDGAAAESVIGMIDDIGRSADRPLLLAVARRAIWEGAERQGILDRYLKVTTGNGEYRLSDAIELLNLVESYKPASVTDLVDRLPKWQETLQQTIDNVSNPSPFFSHHAEHMHGGDRDHRGPDPFRVTAKQDELAFLKRVEASLRVDA